MKQHSADAPLAQGNCQLRKKKRRERLLDGQDVRLLMLHFLAQGPAHGYELIKAIEGLSGGEYAPSPGLIYPGLTLLEESGAISSQEATGGKRAWRLTAAGEQTLASAGASLTSVFARLRALAILVNNRRIPEVERAIGNFKQALHTRLSQEGLSQQTLYTIIDALDNAAKVIERS